MSKAFGTFQGVPCDWYKELRVDESALKAVFHEIRAEAKAQGCNNYPGRDDVASSESLFNDVVARYERQAKVTVPLEKYPHFRRWVLLLFKGGDMPQV